MEIFEAIEGIFSVMFEFVYGRAFNKGKTMKQRLLYLVLYYFVFICLLNIFTYLSFYLITKRDMVAFGCLIFMIPLLCSIAIFYPLIKK